MRTRICSCLGRHFFTLAGARVPCVQCSRLEYRTYRLKTKDYEFQSRHPRFVKGRWKLNASVGEGSK